MADRDRARAMIRAQRVADEAFEEGLGIDFEAWGDELFSRIEAVSMLLDGWRREGAPHPLSSITIATSSGSRYRWVMDGDPLFPMRASISEAGNVFQVFPRYSLMPDRSGVVAAQDAFKEADGVLQTVQAQAAVDAAAATMIAEQDLRAEMGALHDAISR